MEQGGRARSSSHVGNELTGTTRGRSSSNYGLDAIGRNRRASQDTVRKKIVNEDPMQVFMNTYGDIVTRTRQKLQIVKALKVMRKTKPAQHDNSNFVENVEDSSRLAAHSTKLRTIEEIEHDAKKALNAKKIQIRADLFRQGVKGVGVSRHMLHYDSVKRIVGEMDEEKEAERREERQRRRAKRRKEKALLKLKQDQEGGTCENHRPETLMAYGCEERRTSLELDITSIDELTVSVNDDDSFDEEEFGHDGEGFGAKSPPMSRAVSAVGGTLAGSRPTSAPLLKSPSLKSPGLPQKQGSLRSPAGATSTSPVPTSALGTPTLRRSSSMGKGMTDPRLLHIQQMKLKQEEEAKRLLQQKIMDRERKMVDNKKHSEKRAVISQWLRTVVCLSRAHQMTEVVRLFRRKEEMEKQGRALLHAVVMMQLWWMLQRLKLKMHRNPIATRRIRCLVMQKWRVNTIKKRNTGAALIKEFLVESLVLKDIVTKLYAHRKKAMRIQRWVRSFIECRKARILLLSIYIDKVRSKIKRDRRLKEARNEREMKRQLQSADGFGAIILQIDGVQKQINDVLEEEAQKSIDRANEEAKEAQRWHALQMRDAMLAGKANQGGAPTSTYSGGLFDLSQGSSVHQKAYLRKKNASRAKFPAPDVFIHRCMLSEQGYQQLEIYKRIIKQQRKQHWQNFDMREKRKALSNNFVRMEDVASYLKTPPPPAAAAPPLKKKGRQASMIMSRQGSMVMSRQGSTIGSAKKKGKTNDTPEHAYDDAKLLSSIVDAKQSIFHCPFLLLTGSKHLLIDEIKSLSSELWP